MHLRRGVDGDVAGGTLGDAGVVVDDVLVALGALATLLLPLAPVIEVLAEGEGDAAPALEGVVAVGAALHAAALVPQTPAGHAVSSRLGLQAAAEALLVAALLVPGAGAVFAVDGTHFWGGGDKRRSGLVKRGFIMKPKRAIPWEFWKWIKGRLNLGWKITCIISN